MEMLGRADEIEVIKTCIHEGLEYEVPDHLQSKTVVIFCGEVSTEVATVRTYAGNAFDVDGDDVPFTVVVTGTAGSYSATLHNHGNSFELFDTDKARNLRPRPATEEPMDHIAPTGTGPQ